ncbi:MAG: hypothetical protein KDL87_10735 [Verrucomicrobiae bacterium]|nr:hypothetical protein [Verrucomicrobiae bacterium]
MNRRLTFKSSAFPKYPNEDEETVNENCWGKRLAEWVRDNLPRFDIGTEDILCEDWGWLVSLKNDDFPLWVGCGVVEEEGDDGTGEVEFGLFVAAEPGFLKRLFKKVDTAPAVARVEAALEKLVASSDQIRDVSWE